MIMLVGVIINLHLQAKSFSYAIRRKYTIGQLLAAEVSKSKRQESDSLDCVLFI